MLCTPLITFWPSELAPKLSIQLYLQHIDFSLIHISKYFFLFDLSHNYFQWLKNHVVKFRHNTNLALNIISFLFSQPFLFIKNLNPLWRCSKITQRCYITNSTDTFQSIKLAIKTNHSECCILHLLHRHMHIHTRTDLHACKYTMQKEAMKLRQ